MIIDSETYDPCPHCGTGQATGFVCDCTPDEDDPMDQGDASWCFDPDMGDQ